jgi:hypothetical protein
MNTHTDPLRAYKASLKDSLDQEVRKVADQATEADLTLVKRLTTLTEEYSVEMVVMTAPAAALLYLDHNAHNRDFRVPTAREYQRRKNEGEWQSNNATVGLYKDGNLEDAQHRLAAQALAGTTESLVVVRGIDKSAIATIDDGAARHASDAVKLEGILESVRKQQVVKGAATYMTKQGDKDAKLHSEAQVAAEILQHDTVLTRALQLADTSKNGISKPYLKGNQAAVLAYMFLQNGWTEELVKQHLIHMQAGASSSENDKEPRFQCMDYISKARDSKARADRLSAIKELGAIVYSIVEAQKGTKAVNKAMIRQAVKGSTMPDPHFPANANTEFPEAAE